MNVLSLFDGISAGQLALQRAGIPVENYFASEIDKYAIKITQKNFPTTVQLGDVNNWKTWKLPKIDLIIGGSPCQGFSNAGMGLNFDDPRSRLFFMFVDCLRGLAPAYFLLENVKMKKEWRDIITSCVKVDPILINSTLVSAQNRERYYWTNISNVRQPKDRHIFLRDILENGNVDREKSYCIDANYFKGGSLKMYLEKSRRQIDNLSPTTFATGGAIRNQVTKRGVELQLNIRKDGKSNCVVSSYSKRLNGCIQTGVADLNGHDILKRTYDVNGKSPALNTNSGGNREVKITVDTKSWRSLTPLECERLQTFPDNYTEGVSNSQRYKCLGNSWTVDVVAHIFSFIRMNLNVCVRLF